MCFETKKLIERWLRYIILNHEGEIGEKAAGKFSKGICNLKLFEEEYYGGKSFDDYELKRDKLFANGKDWHDIVKFVNIINSVDDYKLLTFILLYKMRTQHNILCDEFREFFIIICERIITITQKVLSTYNE